jgi:hypothetical protein
VRLLLAITLLFPAALAAQARRSAAPRWTEIGKTSQGNAVFIDARSVKRERGIVTAAVRAVFTPPVKSPKGDVTSSRTVAMFDCAARKFAVKENVMYHDEKKGTVFERRAPKVPGYASPFKNSLPEIAMNHLCKS